MFNDEEVFGRRIFVGGLDRLEDPLALEQILREAFEPCGRIVDVHVVRDFETSMGRGFAFVTFADEMSAQAVISQYDGNEIDGRRVGVSLARPIERKNRRES